MVAQGHGKFGPVIVADPRKSFRKEKPSHLTTRKRNKRQVRRRMKVIIQKIQYLVEKKRKRKKKEDFWPFFGVTLETISLD